MKKVGILTHYYHSNNYGGNLQAFALSQYVNSINGFKAEQICYKFDQITQSEAYNKPKHKKNIIIRLFTHPILYFKLFIGRFNLKTLIVRFINSFYKKAFQVRNDAIRNFNENFILHSKKFFSQSDISECNDLYDVFITGSDQVWSSCDYAFVLGFAKEDKTKISYSANIGSEKISNHHSKYLQNYISDYKAISVRNKVDCNILSKLTTKKIDIVLDPVFLLDSKQWEKIIPKNKILNKRYVFSYFLGDSREIKNNIKKFARKKGLEIIHIPNFKDNENSFLLNDLFFGDDKLYDVSPADFVNLIKNAEYVFTDSFHGVVFSIIFHKQFFVFGRESKYGDMNSRLYELLDQFKCKERFCFDNNVDTLLNLNNINYNNIDKIYNEAVKESKEFIYNSLVK